VTIATHTHVHQRTLADTQTQVGHEDAHHPGLRTWLRDDEAAGSNPATPTEKFQVDAMIAKRGDHVIDHLLAIHWRGRTSVRGMQRGGLAGNTTAA
jgi:hypothetical protein